MKYTSAEANKLLKGIQGRIIDIARKIDTFETSSLPYEDCCTVFTPRHPATHPKLDKIELSEKQLDTEALIQEAIDGIEVVCL